MFEIDPALIETTGRLDDRLELDVDGLKASVSRKRQRVPILVRPELYRKCPGGAALLDVFHQAQRIMDAGVGVARADRIADAKQLKGPAAGFGHRLRLARDQGGIVHRTAVG